MEKHVHFLRNAGKKFPRRNTYKEDSEAAAKFARERVVGLEVWKKTEGLVIEDLWAL